ncbi:reverse transcriptase domain-containing protein [Tanacetum coccineum]|uniref:Reverse transcriptase domain-containing protein n=1 Tax=Tanacetum coccineum TaxID=301880 RepID=A0ABQ4XV06_9ASTR
MILTNFVTRCTGSHEMQKKWQTTAILQERVSEGMNTLLVKCNLPTYPDFLKCKPLNFKGTEGVVRLTQWFEKMESVFNISNCTVASQVQICDMNSARKALTWWILAHVKRTGTNVAIRNVSEKSRQETSENKRKLDNNNQTQQQLPKRQNVAQAYAAGTGERKEYAGTLPLCNKCKFHHNGPCTVKCANCKRVGHLTRDCWSSAATNNQRTLTCYECRDQGHYRSDAPN